MEDASHLRTLSICYYVYAGLVAFFSIFAMLYAGFGGAVLMGKIPMSPKGTGAPNSDQMVGGFFLGFGLLFTVIIIAMAVLCFLTARWIAARKHPVFCMVTAALCALNMPLGTLLGVFTFIVMLRPSVQELFRDGPEKNNFVHH